MQVFLYEHITAGGLLVGGETPGGSLLREGGAMLAALAADVAAVPGAAATVLWDERLPRPEQPSASVVPVDNAAQQERAFRRLSAASDWTIVIAPEFEGILLDRCRMVLDSGGRLLGPSPDVVQLASDKQATADYLSAAGLSVPHGSSLRTSQRLPGDFAYPAVLKPRDGAGSQGVRLIRSADDMPNAPWPARLEEFCPGEPASVAVIGGPRGPLVLEPCRQHLSGDGLFTYQGGSLPLPPTQAERARRLGQSVAAALPPFVGYLGIDLVLGPDSGVKDRVIEVNPRLTTSYVGPRLAVEQNLAAVMIDLAQGGQPRLTYRAEGVVFDAAGNATRSKH
jgi:predicted ATP-grasp superfamily ATP-dependent carboligase